MTSYGLNECFWAMFEPTWTWPNFTCGQLFMWIGANNDQIRLHMGWTSDSEQCSNRLKLYPISINFSCELGQIMTRYDFLSVWWARRVILSNVQTNSKRPNFEFGSFFLVNWGQWLSDDFLWARRVILSDVQTRPIIFLVNFSVNWGK